jgi:hypothetical protein
VKVAFLYPGGWVYEAVGNWLRTLARHSSVHEVVIASHPRACEADVYLAVTVSDLYPRELIDRHLCVLAADGKPFGVLHNNDCVPTPGHYPSFVWTRSGMQANHVYGPELVRMPVFGPLVPAATLPTCLATFGHVEPKKHVREMGAWARSHGLSFYACGPDTLAVQYADYIDRCCEEGVQVATYPWQSRVEDLADMFAPVSHFLFVLPTSKGGGGGSPTSPRYAGFFNRPVIVIDDEDTYRQDRYYVFGRLENIDPLALPTFSLPCYEWSPDAYLGHLAARVLAFWRC